MNIARKIYCRVFQEVFHIAIPFLPYRKPTILSSVTELPKLFKDKKYSNDQFMKEVNRLVNVETKDEETLLANIQQAQNVLFTRYKKNQINSNDDLSEIAYQINVFIKCLQTLPTEEEDEE